MNERIKYLFKNAGILTVSNFSSKILTVLLIPLYTSVLSTAEYGTYDLIVSAVALLYPVLTVSVSDAVMRFTLDGHCEKEKVLSVGIKYVLFSVCAFGMALIFFRCLHLFPTLYGLEMYIFLYYLASVSNQFLAQLAKGLEKVKDMGISGVLGTFICLAANIVFLLVFKLGLKGFFIANTIAPLFASLYLFVRLKIWEAIRDFKTDSQMEKQMLAYSAPLIFTSLGWWVNNAADKYVVAFFLGTAATGLLSVAYKIPSIINTVQVIFMQAWQISAIKVYSEADAAEFYGKMFSYCNIAMSILCSVLILLSKPLAHILYANDFYAAWQYVPFLLISSVINTASGLIGPILSAKKNTSVMAVAAIYGAVANIVMNIGLVYMIEIQGATIATMISSFIIFCVRKKAAGDDLKIRNFNTVLLSWMLLILQASIHIYSNAWYLEIGIMCVLCIVNKGALQKMVVCIINNVQGFSVKHYK